MSGNSWYDTGFQGMSAEQARLDAQYGPNRFWVKKDTSKDIVFVDDEPVCVHEHNPKINGDYKNWITCLSGSNDDVVCCQKLGLDTRYYCGYLTVVDCTEWVDQKGNKHNYEIKLIQAKLRTLKKFRRKKDDRGSLVGMMYRSSRTDDKSPTCGDEFEFVRPVDMEKLFGFVTYKGKTLSELWDDAERNQDKMASLMRTFQVKPNAEGKLPRVVPLFNYYQLLAPKTPQELRVMLGAVEKDDRRNSYGSNERSGGGGSSGGTRGGTNVESDDIPF